MQILKGKRIIKNNASNQYGVALIFLMTLFAPLDASASVVSINRVIDAGGVSGTIETDGSIGVLSTANITDWDLVIDDGAGTFNLLGPSSGNNSGVRIGGTGLSATVTELLMDFDALGVNFLIFQAPNVGSGRDGWCIGNGCFGTDKTERVFVGTGGTQSVLHSGVEIVGRISGAVPEPSMLTLFALGFVGLGFRSKRVRQ